MVDDVRAVKAGRLALMAIAERLERLREAAGSPSLRALDRLTNELGCRLPRATISEKLKAGSFVDEEFVRAFVTACLIIAERKGLTIPEPLADLRAWDAEYLATLQAFDQGRADDALAAAARAELERLVSKGRPPRQLPPATRHFTGRADELAIMSGLLRDPSKVGGTVVISAIGGTAGVGKTALAMPR